MKTISVILVLLLIASSLTVQAEDKSAVDRSVHLCIVLDCGATSQRNWDMLKTTAIETLYSLKPGDRVEVIAAYPFKTDTQIDATISAEGKGDYEKMVKKLTALDKELLFGSDMSKAVESAYQHLGKNDHGRKCCVILTSGKLNDGHVKEIRQLGLAFKARDWPLLLVCDHSAANRQLLVSGIDIRYINDLVITDWITSAVKKPALTPLPPKEPLPSQLPLPRRITAEPNNPKPSIKTDPLPKPIEAETLKSLPAKQNDPTPASPLGPIFIVVPTETDKSKPVDFTKAGTPTPPKFETVVPPKAPGTAKAGKTDVIPTAEHSNWSWLITAILFATALVIAIVGYWLIDKRTIVKNRKFLENQAISSMEKTQKRLVAFVGEHRYDLGEMSELKEVMIGKGLGCSIFIEHEKIQDKHLRIFKSKKALKIQNLSDAALTANGNVLQRGQKSELFLPAEIVLNEEITISLIEDEVNLEKECVTNEKANL